MDLDTTALIENDDHSCEQKQEETWVAVKLKTKDDPLKNQVFNQTTSSAESRQQSLKKTVPLIMKSSSGNQVGYDMDIGSPPMQDSQLVHRLEAFAVRAESPAQFQQGWETPPHPQSIKLASVAAWNQQNPSPRAGSPPLLQSPSPLLHNVLPKQQTPIPSSIESNHQTRGNLTVPMYQGGFGSLRPGFASNRNDLAFSVTANYYGDNDPHHQSYAAPVMVRKSQMKQSKRMPYWMRYIILKLVGVKTRENETPLVGAIFYSLTLALGLLYVSTHTLFLAYNAMSSVTTLTTIEASLQILNCLFGTSLGIYANRMAVKLFGNQKLLDSIRMHTKSVLKIRASNWALILILGFITADFYDRYVDILVNANDHPMPAPTHAQPATMLPKPQSKFGMCNLKINIFSLIE
jgi:hypothetical protein